MHLAFSILPKQIRFNFNVFVYVVRYKIWNIDKIVKSNISNHSTGNTKNVSRLIYTQCSFTWINAPKRILVTKEMNRCRNFCFSQKTNDSRHRFFFFLVRYQAYKKAYTPLKVDVNEFLTTKSWIIAEVKCFQPLLKVEVRFPWRRFWHL